MESYESGRYKKRRTIHRTADASGGDLLDGPTIETQGGEGKEEAKEKKPRRPRKSKKQRLMEAEDQGEEQEQEQEQPDYENQPIKQRRKKVMRPDPIEVPDNNREAYQESAGRNVRYSVKQWSKICSEKRKKAKGLIL